MISQTIWKGLLSFFIIQFFAVEVLSAQDSTRLLPWPVYGSASLLYDFPQSYGITGDFNAPLSSVIKSKISSNGRITKKQKDVFIATATGVYRYPFNHTGLFLLSSIGVRRVKECHYHQFSVGVGILRTFYDGKVYEVDASSGNIKELPFFGRFYATANFSYAMGWQLKKVSLKKFALQLKPQLWFQFPYNSFVKPHMSFEAGVRYDVGRINTRTRTPRKHKSE